MEYHEWEDKERDRPVSPELEEESWQNRKKTERRYCSRLWFCYVAFILASTGSQLLFALLAAPKLPAAVKADQGLWLFMATLPIYVCGFPTLWFLVRRIPAQKPEGSRRMTAGKWFLCFIACSGFTYIGNIVGQILMYIVNQFISSPVTNPVEEMVSRANLPAIFVSVVLLAPVMEELIFRKLLIDRMLRYGQLAAVLASGISFGLFHGNFYQFFYACGLGMIFAYIYSATGKLRYTILLHMAINFMGSMIPLAILSQMEKSVIGGVIGSLILLLYILTAIVVSVVLLIVNRKKITFFSGTHEVPRGKRFQTICLNLGAFTFFAFCVWMFLMG